MSLRKNRKKQFKVFKNFSFFLSFSFLFLAFSSFFLIVKYENETNSLRIDKIPELTKDNDNNSQHIETTKKNIGEDFINKLEEKVRKINNRNNIDCLKFSKKIECEKAEDCMWDNGLVQCLISNQLQKVQNNQKIIEWVQ